MKLGVLVVVVVAILRIDEAGFHHFIQVLERWAIVLKSLVHHLGTSVDVVHLLVQPLVVLAQPHPLYSGVEADHVVGVELGSCRGTLVATELPRCTPIPMVLSVM